MDALTAASACLHELIEDQARRTPGRTALVFEGERLSYGELNRRAGAVARRLRALGAGPEVRVALFMERSLSMMVGVLGILKAGAAYLPIDPLYPRARIGFILEDAGATIALTQRGLVAMLPGGTQSVLCMDEISCASHEPAVPRKQETGPHNLAYVIYTSGSTGRPKGVCIEHRNIVNYVLGIADRLRFSSDMQHALVSTLAADLGNTVTFPALATGACLHVISAERAESQALLAEYFGRERIDVLKIAPSHLAALQGGRHPESVMPRKRLILGGEPCPLERVAELRAMAPECEIHNHYGPTETTVGVLTYRVDGTLPSTPSRMLPLGAPLPNCRTHVLRPDGTPCAVGEEGELCIGGAGVGRGYLNRPDLTAERFVVDPFSPGDGRLYRSGDRARVLPDGAVEFCGRTDDQVKLGGHRVELAEIEHALREYGGVRDAVVLAREDVGGAKQLLAYITPRHADQPLWNNPSVHVLPDGTPVAHLNRSETDYLYNEIFVLQAYLRHGISIGEGDYVVDAGANIGLFTVFADRLARGLRIFAFEPNPAAFACLEANAKALGAKVACFPYGLSSEEKFADMTFFQGMSLLSGFHADAASERAVVEAYARNQQAVSAGGDGLSGQLRELIDERLQAQRIRTRLRRLSDVIAEQAIERIDLLKINVEKSEHEVLLGLGAGDWPKIRQMVIEVDRSASLEPIRSLLAGHGFDVRVEQDPLLRNTELHYVYARHHGDGQLARDEGTDSQRRRLAGDERILTAAGLRKHLGARLPRHMVPQAFFLMDRLPLLPNGKLDRGALPIPGSGQRSVDFVRPRTETEKSLAALWSELLQVDAIGIDDDFFDLGGKSLVAMRMIARIRDAHGVDVQLRHLFERPTIAALAELVDGLVWARNSAAPPPAAGEREELAL
jgi:amino acid adenylation domain-containing protein/FkbM family methyltransferase